jgi:hypothetical protein
LGLNVQGRILASTIVQLQLMKICFCVNPPVDGSTGGRFGDNQNFEFN